MAIHRSPLIQRLPGTLSMTSTQCHQVRWCPKGRSSLLCQLLGGPGRENRVLSRASSRVSEFGRPKPSPPHHTALFRKRSHTGATPCSPAPHAGLWQHPCFHTFPTSCSRVVLIMLQSCRLPPSSSSQAASHAPLRVLPVKTSCMFADFFFLFYWYSKGTGTELPI